MNNSIEQDLRLDIPFAKQDQLVRNCWHFYSRGEDVDMMFLNRTDYEAGMNRIYATQRKYKLVILAFALMDTHFHFVLHGDFDQCNRFVHEYMRRTSQYISITHKDKRKLESLSINHQVITTDTYLKTVICYVIKNAATAGMPYQPTNYPWSSGPLYFAGDESWASPLWKLHNCNASNLNDLSSRRIRQLIHSNDYHSDSERLIGNIVFPGEYVQYKTVERLFRTYRAFNYFISQNREKDVESNGGEISLLSIPMQEMRQNRDAVRSELFGAVSQRELTTSQRIRLAKTLRHRFNSSPKQIARLCGLVYDEIREFITL